ncbi:helix-turn-helix domain protein [Caldicellulosiruptor owensensis OL]|uniref:Helix-turn-helix domain protein n=1 Tax=Caldicellulosiruptor owensensis (strain ATCC 700167 / DSM 13100 / OL) TaxID=632518 RepID=E4Q659_CALOW|nr:helix-turn-helix transcriptional regulator [Caldicellulosiruptor owensensis]ADQ05544.1 helix-turn-helix domain protein [Caldicellulosiruptor owensensis OL]
MFGERLRMLRNEKGFTMQQMAEMLGITIGSWAKYERNEAEPSFDKLVKIADIFNVSVDFLLGRTNVRNDKLGNNETNIKNYIVDIEKIIIENPSALYCFQTNFETVLENFSKEIISENQLQPLLEALNDLVIYFNDLTRLKSENKKINKEILTYHEKEKISMLQLMNKIFMLLFQPD